MQNFRGFVQIKYDSDSDIRTFFGKNSLSGLVPKSYPPLFGVLLRNPVASAIIGVGIYRYPSISLRNRGAGELKVALSNAFRFELVS